MTLLTSPQSACSIPPYANPFSPIFLHLRHSPSRPTHQLISSTQLHPSSTPMPPNSTQVNPIHHILTHFPIRSHPFPIGIYPNASAATPTHRPLSSRRTPNRAAPTFSDRPHPPARTSPPRAWLVAVERWNVRETRKNFHLLSYFTQYPPPSTPIPSSSPLISPLSPPSLADQHPLPSPPSLSPLPSVSLSSPHFIFAPSGHIKRMVDGEEKGKGRDVEGDDGEEGQERKGEGKGGKRIGRE